MFPATGCWPSPLFCSQPEPHGLCQHYRERSGSVHSPYNSTAGAGPPTPEEERRAPSCFPASSSFSGGPVALGSLGTAAISPPQDPPPRGLYRDWRPGVPRAESWVVGGWQGVDTKQKQWQER